MLYERESKLYTRALEGGPQANTKGTHPIQFMLLRSEKSKDSGLTGLEQSCVKNASINGVTTEPRRINPHLRTSLSISSRLLAEMLSCRSLRYTGPIFSEYPQFCERHKASFVATVDI